MADGEEILNGGRIIAGELKDAANHHAERGRETIKGYTETAPVIVTFEKWKYEMVEYSDPGDRLED